MGAAMPARKMKTSLDFFKAENVIAIPQFAVEDM